MCVVLATNKLHALNTINQTNKKCLFGAVKFRTYIYHSIYFYSVLELILKSQVKYIDVENNKTVMIYITKMMLKGTVK